METRAENPNPEDFRFFCPVQPRFRDLDPMGHVNNAVYFTYFEMARTGYLQAIGWWPADARPLTERFPFILLQIGCRYLSPARVEDGLRVGLRTSRIGHKSFEFEYWIDAGAERRPVAAGRSVQVFYDYQAGRSLPVAEDFRRQILDYEGAGRVELG